MLIEKIYQAALPYLEEKTVTDFRYGVNLACCQLSDGSIGISHVFIEEIIENPSTFAAANTAIGKSAKELASKICNGTMPEKIIAATILNAVSGLQDLSDDNENNPFGIDVKPSDNMAVIGRIPPVIKQFKNKVNKMRIYDMGLEARGGAPDLSPMSEQKDGLAKSDIVITTGTSVLNSTIDGLLEMSTNAREIVIVGPTTPMFPEAFKGTNVTRLAGSICISGNKDEFFTYITRGCSVFHLSKYLQKKCVVIGNS
jgi:uncharacterized protein (DUF4213/DUF364 family)